MQDPLENVLRRLERLVIILGIADVVLFLTLVGLILLIYGYNV